MMIRSKEYKIPEIKLSYVADRTIERPKMMKTSDVAEVLYKSYDMDEIDYRESFKVVYLDRANRFIGIHTISIGGTNATVVDAKIIFTGALLVNASAMVLCHNHPSGTLKPSIEDDRLTRKISEAGRLLDIKVFDHIILTSEGYYSYADEEKI